MKKELKAGAIIVVLILVYGFVTIGVGLFESKNEAKELNVFGVIENIKVDTLDHATPYFLINDHWEYLWRYGRSMHSFVQPGDSVAKAQGQDKMVVYRKDKLGRYEVLKEVDL